MSLRLALVAAAVAAAVALLGYSLLHHGQPRFDP